MVVPARQQGGAKPLWPDGRTADGNDGDLMVQMDRRMEILVKWHVEAGGRCA